MDELTESCIIHPISSRQTNKLRRTVNCNCLRCLQSKASNHNQHNTQQSQPPLVRHVAREDMSQPLTDLSSTVSPLFGREYRNFLQTNNGGNGQRIDPTTPSQEEERWSLRYSPPQSVSIGVVYQGIFGTKFKTSYESYWPSTLKCSVF